MESSIYDQTKDISDHIDQPSVTPDSQTTDNSSSKFSDSLSTQVDRTFTSKGLHNVRHFLPKMDELTLMIGTENGPDIIGICETFFGSFRWSLSALNKPLRFTSERQV